MILKTEEILNFKEYCKKNNLNFKLDKNSIYNFSSAEIDGSNVQIILPMVSMNNSGDAIKSYFKYNKKENTEVLIVHDDIDLAFGRLRIKKGSSDGGHNGIKSANRVLNAEDYYKLKVGVGRPPQGLDQLILYCQSFIMMKEKRLNS